MNVRRENIILRIPRVPKNYSMGYTFHVRGVKGVHINCTPKLFMIESTIHDRIHYSCEKRKYAFILLPIYSISFHNSIVVIMVLKVGVIK